MGFGGNVFWNGLELEELFFEEEELEVIDNRGWGEIGVGRGRGVGGGVVVGRGWGKVYDKYY